MHDDSITKDELERKLKRKKSMNKHLSIDTSETSDASEETEEKDYSSDNNSNTVVDENNKHIVRPHPPPPSGSHPIPLASPR
jgi:hypothetical protein